MFSTIRAKQPMKTGSETFEKKNETIKQNLTLTIKYHCSSCWNVSNQKGKNVDQNWPNLQSCNMIRYLRKKELIQT